MIFALYATLLYPLFPLQSCDLDEGLISQFDDAQEITDAIQVL